ncbi:MAG TPA: transcription-repair coupling factor [Nitrospirota bacterium]
MLFVAATPKEAEEIERDYKFFARAAGGPSSRFLPPWDVLPYDVIAPDPAVVSARLGALRAISSGEAQVLIAPVNAVLQRLPRPENLVGETTVLTISRGQEIDLEVLIEKLAAIGYSRTNMVYEPGDFSVRGGILDVFPPAEDGPVRAEFFGDAVESIRRFDPDTQRSVVELDDIRLLPAKESEAGGGLDGLITDYFTGGPVVVVDEPARVSSHAREFEARVFAAFEHAGQSAAQSTMATAGRPRPESQYLTADGFAGLVEAHSNVALQSLVIEGPSETVDFHTRSVEGMRLRDAAPEPWPAEIPKTAIAIFCLNLKNLMRGRAVNAVSATQGQAQRLMEIFAEYGIPAEEGAPLYELPAGFASGGLVRIVIGGISSGFLMEDPPVAFIGSQEIFGEKPRHAPAPRAKVERFLTSLSELAPGDYVVHADHGIGQYMGLKRLKLMGVEADFLDVIYSGSDRLYVPVDELGKVQKYIGAEGPSAHLDKLGGTGWERTKQKAKKAVAEMAKELLELYAARAVAPGFAYSPDDHLYREMESSFEYEETPDQARAIVDVKEDLESPHPMDRLVCGDVGYGKTEVAVRAAFKVVLDGRQAAVLVPTTLLAEQHYNTFMGRLSAFPVRVEMLSRFTPKERVKGILAGISDGSVDIVIGTHRILSKDVSFHQLGMLVIDEEHRFGVTHKEKLKTLKKNIDVLTLTATPIPRTLNLSITGIRDLSIIETPPPDRQPIKTLVTKFDQNTIREAILRELMRGGQVFFVHNRIESIFAIGELLRRLVPEAKISVAHGRMHEKALEDIMTKFVSGETNLLLTTSIIESGLDIPAANTIIIDRADRFGLAELYQLRGRVGRSRQRAYAYLLVPGEDALTEVAQKRLRVLSELTSLGAGFKLALHDLEIRGAGNLLGGEQSGHIAAVGFEMYTHLLETAVHELKGEEVEEVIDPALDLKVSAFIPDSYIPDTAHRLGVYKKLSGAASAEEVADIRAELADRFGAIPPDALRLTQVMELKVLARTLKVGGISVLPSEVKLTFTGRVDISPDKLLSFLNKWRGKARYVPEYNIFIKKPAGGWEELFRELAGALKGLA